MMNWHWTNSKPPLVYRNSPSEAHTDGLQTLPSVGQITAEVVKFHTNFLSSDMWNGRWMAELSTV